jgi:NAD(P)-dependent dehydrogenase (short-subunit alcohol dehydrogenase family)
MQELKGKAAIVTGAASGIGLGIARALAGAGMNLVLADIQAAPLEEARRLIEAAGVRAVIRRTDVSDPDQVTALARMAEEAFGGLRVACNNAGVAMHGTPLDEVSAEEWRWVLGVNVLGVINGIRAFVPLIRRQNQGGHIVNTASISGFFIRDGANQGAYSMTKYAVVALSEALEQELEGSGIGVSVLCPGPVRTRIFEGAATRPDQFGGPYARPEHERIAARLLGTGALAPEQVGARVLHAIRENEFYVFTHGAERAAVRARHARIEAALDQADAFWEGSEGRQESN